MSGYKCTMLDPCELRGEDGYCWPKNPSTPRNCRWAQKAEKEDTEHKYKCMAIVQECVYKTSRGDCRHKGNMEICVYAKRIVEEEKRECGTCRMWHRNGGEGWVTGLCSKDSYTHHFIFGCRYWEAIPPEAKPTGECKECALYLEANKVLLVAIDVMLEGILKAKPEPVEVVRDEVCGECAYYNRDNGDGLGSVCCHKEGPDLFYDRVSPGKKRWRCVRHRPPTHYSWCEIWKPHRYESIGCTCGLEAGRKKV